jgi:DNA-binding transcriptional MerR regulator
MPLQPGTYRITELASLAGVTRTTVDKWELRYSLQKTLVEHDNREVAAYILTAENIERLSREYPSISNGVDTGSSTQSQPLSQGYQLVQEYQSEQIEELKARNLALEKELETSRSNLSSVQMKCSKLEGLLENHNLRLADKDAIIAAKDQAINAANAAVMLLEEKKSPAIETSENNQMSNIPTGEQKKGWFDKILGR